MHTHVLESWLSADSDSVGLGWVLGSAEGHRASRWPSQDLAHQGGLASANGHNNPTLTCLLSSHTKKSKCGIQVISLPLGDKIVILKSSWGCAGGKVSRNLPPDLLVRESLVSASFHQIKLSLSL